MSWLTTEGATHQISDGETVVGSGPHAAWRLESHDLTARHFVISSHGAKVTVHAATIEAVIAVNGHQIGLSPAELHDGDTIDAGSARFSFTTSHSGAVPAVPVPPAHLVETRGGVVHPLTQQSVGIGRDKTNVIVVRDPTASRFHAEVRREAGGYVLHPHGSSGTTLNGRRTGTPERLEDGDRIEIANVEMRFASGPAPEGSPRADTSGLDEESSHRRTIVQSTVMEIPKEDRTRSNTWIWIIAATVLAGTVYLATR